MKIGTNICLTVLWMAIVIFSFGPGVVGGFDLACWFITDFQCTSVIWTDGRMAWAIFPWVLLVTFVLLGAGL